MPPLLYPRPARSARWSRPRPLRPSDCAPSRTGRPGLQRPPLAVGDQLLLHTYGVTEARDRARAFHPPAEGVARHMSEEPARTLSALHDELLARVGGRLYDAAAVLLLRGRTADEPRTNRPPYGRDSGGGISGRDRLCTARIAAEPRAATVSVPSGWQWHLRAATVSVLRDRGGT
ncbi:SpoIIE family protein phosphatase [Streptomyces sp. NPDC006309]|uniref:SpoIIE family protein phosphatase n=1 Tax=Streptomyces sp. NPDC006309 TaxID=3156749 RepID=UPI0033BAA947